MCPQVRSWGLPGSPCRCSPFPDLVPPVLPLPRCVDKPWPAPGLPFLCAGRIVGSDTAGVHVLREGGTVVGLQIASEY